MREEHDAQVASMHKRLADNAQELTFLHRARLQLEPFHQTLLSQLPRTAPVAN